MRLLILLFCFLLLLFTSAMLSCSDDDKGTTPTTDLPVRPIDGTYQAGSYSFCYDQGDASGHVLPPRSYQVVVETHNGYSVTLAFVVRSGAVSVAAPVCSDTAMDKHTIPSAYDAWLNDSVYAPGDTIGIRVDLPAADSVVVTVQ